MTGFALRLQKEVAEAQVDTSRVFARVGGFGNMPRKPKIFSRWPFRRRLPKPERREIVEISDVAAILARRDPLFKLLDTLSG